MFCCLCFAFVLCHVLYLHALLLCRCALLFIIVPCYFALLLIVTPCCFALLLAMPYYSLLRLLLTFAPCCSLSCLTTCNLRLVVCLLFFQVPLATPPIVALLLCCSPSFLVIMPFYVNWDSFPTFLCKWRSLEQNQQVSFNKLR